MNTNKYAPEHVEDGSEIHHILWRGIEVEISWRDEFLSSGFAHLELRSKNSEPLPMTETGYRSHFVHREEVEEYGWPVAYVEAWLAELDDGKPIQLELF